MKKKLLLVFTSIFVFILAGCGLLSPTKTTVKPTTNTTNTTKTTASVTQTTSKTQPITVDGDKVTKEKALMVTEIVSFAVENNIANLDTAEKINLVLSDALTTLATYGVTAQDLRLVIRSAKSLIDEIQTKVTQNGDGTTTVDLTGMNAELTKFFALNINYHAFIQAALVVAEDSLGSMLLTLKEMKIQFEAIKESDPYTFMEYYADQYNQIIDQVATYERLLDAIRNDKEALVDAALFAVDYIKHFQGSLPSGLFKLFEDVINNQPLNVTTNQIKQFKQYLTTVIENNVPDKDELENVFGILFEVFVPKLKDVDKAFLANEFVKTFNLSFKLLKAIKDDTIEALSGLALNGSLDITQIQIIDYLALVVRDINDFYKGNASEITLSEEEIDFLVDFVLLNANGDFPEEVPALLKDLIKTLYDSGFDAVTALLDHLATTELQVVKELMIAQGFMTIENGYINYVTGETYSTEDLYLAAIEVQFTNVFGTLADALIVIKNNVSNEEFKNIISKLAEMTFITLNLNTEVADVFIKAVQNFIKDNGDAIYNLIVNAINYIDQNNDLYTKIMDGIASGNPFATAILVANMVNDVLTSNVATGLDKLVQDLIGLITDQRFTPLFGFSEEQIAEFEEALLGRFTDVRSKALLIKDLDANNLTEAEENKVLSFMESVQTVLNFFNSGSSEVEYLE